MRSTVAMCIECFISGFLLVASAFVAIPCTMLAINGIFFAMLIDASAGQSFQTTTALLSLAMLIWIPSLVWFCWLRRRTPWRFSLRELCIVMTLAAIWCGILVVGFGDAGP
jgi:hypothetical protein